MNCPVCSTAMVDEDFGGVHVNVCRDGCQGLWFDWHELTRLDEGHEGVGRALESAMQSPRAPAAPRGRLQCPRCQIPMHAHRYPRAQEVDVDECYGCGGFFLDPGELHAVRQQHMSPAEEEAYVAALTAELPEFQELRADTARVEERAVALRHMTRYLRPSYWITRQ